MATSTLFSRASLLILSLSQLALSLSLSSQLPTAAVLALSLSQFTLTAADKADAPADTADTEAQECTEPGTCGPTGNRLIFAEELATHTGKGGASPSNPIWLSILGKVYDVTTGEQFYGEEKGDYRFYSGRDASPCFSTGNNTPEGAEQNVDEWEDKKLIAIYEWAEFYEVHNTYKYLGDLAGSKYFDAQGNELDYRKNIVSRSKEALRVIEEEKERKRAELIKERQAKNAENGRYSHARASTTMYTAATVL